MKGSYWIINTNYGAFLTNQKDFIGNKVCDNGVWEPEVVNIYEAILEPHYEVVDIGAHMGFHTVNFAKHSKQVYAFEPQRHLYNQVCGNIFLNELDDRVVCFNVGLGETNKRSSFGSLDKHNTLTWPGNTGIELINYGGRALEDDLGTDEIEIRTLDSFNLAPHFIKMDIEGYELKTLQGSIETINNHHPIILFECFIRNQEQVIPFLKNLGYEIYNIPHPEGNDDFIALHPQFEQYNKTKNKIDKFNIYGQ